MDYKYLTRKQYVLEGGLTSKDDSTVIIPFANMDVELVSTFQPGDKVTLATEEKMEELLNASVVSSHKTIIGELAVADTAEAQAAIATYTNGGDLTLSNGRVFNNGNASPGEILFLIPTAGSTFKAEEVIVGAIKELITLSNENSIDAQFTIVEDRVKAVEDSILLKEDTTDVDTKIAAEAKARDDKDILIYGEVTANTGKIDTNVSALGTVNGRIDTVNAKDLDQDGRLEALEEAESLDDKVWTGSEQGDSTISLSGLLDQNGSPFTFTAGKKIEIVMEHTSSEVEQGQNIVIGSANATPFSIGTVGFTAKISATGILTLVKPAGAGNISDFALVRMVEALAAQAVNTGYTKNVADARFATPAQVAAVDTKVTTLTTTVNTKQPQVDSNIKDPITKSVVGAINNLIDRADSNDPLVARLGGLKTTDGDDLSTTTEVLVTDKTLTAKGYITQAEMTAAITAAFNTVMDVTFDDSSTGTYKIGK